VKILFTAQSYHPNVCGVQRVVQSLSERLADRSHEVTVATTFHPERQYRVLNNVHVRQFAIKGSPLRGWRGEVEKYRNFVEKHPFDVMVNVYTRCWSTDLLYSRLAKLSAIKILMAGGFSILHNWKWLIYRWRMLYKIKNYDHITYHFEGDDDHVFGNRHGIRDYSIIGNGVAEQEFEEYRGGFRVKYVITTPLMFLCVSNYEALKNQEMVLKAYQKANIPNSTMVFIGSKLNDYSRGLEGSVRLKKGSVRFIERVPREMVVAAYHEADLFLFGSRIECFPLVILEAMASRTPFIGRDVGCVARLEGGQIVSSDDEMAASINRLADKGPEWHTLAEQGRKAYKEKYQWEKIADQYEELFWKHVNGNSRK